MKKNYLFRVVPATVLAGVLALLSFGCGKNQGGAAAPSLPAATPAATPAVVSAEKTSFAEVTSQLDSGGNFYLYLGTAQWLTHLSGRVEAWRSTVAAAPGLGGENAATVNKAFDLVTHLIQDSGIEDVSGVGMSSVEIEKGMYRNKALLHHYAGQGNGFLWQLAGKEPHALTGLDLLPANTALAVFSDMDLPVLWRVTQKEVSRADLPQAQQWLDQLPAQFEQQTKVKWNTFLDSLGGEFGLAVTLDPSNNIPVPLPGAALDIPTPGLLLAVKVNDDTIFNRIDAELKANASVVSVDKPGLKMRTLPLPLPFIGELRPSAASSGGYLFIATSDALIDEALAVRAGQKPGLKATAEFKHLSQGLPERGNQFCYMSQRFAETLMQVQQQAVIANAKTEPQMAQWMQSCMRSRPAFAYSVGVNTPEGCLTVGNSSQSYANTVLLPALIVPGMLAAIAVPNFVKAREVSQQNSCINNLRQLDAAKNQWALENNKRDGAVPTKQDLLPYLRQWPVCPQGGTYTIGPVGEAPHCSVPGHVLP